MYCISHKIIADVLFGSKMQTIWKLIQMEYNFWWTEVKMLVPNEWLVVCFDIHAIQIWVHSKEPRAWNMERASFISIVHPLSFEIIWPSQWFFWKAWLLAFQRLVGSVAYWKYLPKRIRHVFCWLVSIVHPIYFETIWPYQWFCWKA